MDKQVIFKIGDQYYGIDSLKVKTIGTSDGLTPLPGAPGNVAGVVNMRGAWSAVYSLHKKFGVVPSQENCSVIYVDTSEGILGVEVDSVSEIAEVDTDFQTGVPAILQSKKTGYALGIINHKGNLVTLINPDEILSPAEAALLAKCLKLRREEEEKAKAELELQKALEEAKRKEEEEAQKASE